MLQIKVNETGELLKADEFSESMDMFDGIPEYFIRISFDTLTPFGDDSMDYLMGIFADIDTISLYEDDTEVLKILGEFKLQRISRENRRGKFMVAVTIRIIK